LFDSGNRNVTEYFQVGARKDTGRIPSWSACGGRQDAPPEQDPPRRRSQWVRVGSDQGSRGSFAAEHIGGAAQLGPHPHEPRRRRPGACKARALDEAEPLEIVTDRCGRPFRHGAYPDSGSARPSATRGSWWRGGSFPGAHARQAARAGMERKSLWSNRSGSSSRPPGMRIPPNPP